MEQNYDFANFRVNSILNNNTKNKTVCLVGNFIDLSETDRALVILEKTAFTVLCHIIIYCSSSLVQNDDENIFTENDLQSSSENLSGFFSSKSVLKEDFVNDIYGNFHCFPSPDINSVKTTIIYPATEKHIEKYSSKSIHIVQETPELYQCITLPYLKRNQFSLEWVYNILEHKKEFDRIAFEDPCKENGFVLLPDLKWDGKTSETLYLLALTHKRDIKSLRDLTTEHLPLLRNIRNKSIDVIQQKYGVKRSKLRIYIHYQPSFYHLHIHFTYLNHEAPGIFCEKSHLLDTVINNIELMPDYYQRSTLSFVLNETDGLFERFIEEPAVKRPKIQE